MARIRTIKPEFFRHEGLQDLEASNPGACTMLVFAGLWGHCDKVGTFEWKPRTLKLDLLPFLSFDMAVTLNLLEEAGFLVRFEAEGKTYGNIPSFAEHQRIGGKEAEAPGKYPGSTGEAPGKHRELQEGKGREREKEGKGNGEARERAPDDLDIEAWTRWERYRREIRKPLKPASIPAAQRALAAFGCDQSAVVEQSIAQGWQGLFPLKTANGAHVLPNPEAQEAWLHVLAEKPRTPRMQAAVEAVGGWPRIRQRTEFDDAKMRAAFFAAYASAKA